MVTRISNNMVYYNFLSSLNKSLNKQYTLQEQLADGKAIHRPSDDPVKTMRSLRFTVSLTENEEYTKHVSDARSWMETTDGALYDINNVIQSARELVIGGIEPNPAIAYETIAEQLDGLINHMVELGNTKLGDRYIFAGQADRMNSKPPFERQNVPAAVATAAGLFEADGVTPQTDQVVYNGDTQKISMVIKPGAVTPAQDSVNLTGQDLFGDPDTHALTAVDMDGDGTNDTKICDVFNMLIQIKQEFQKNPPDLTWLSGTGLGNIDKIHDQVLKAQTTIGSRSVAYEMAENMLTKFNTQINADIGANEDLDLSKGIVDFKTAETVYRTALSVGARIMPVSLADFLN
ncbi:MAG TPA: flagellar hook-associated protein FlgL [Methylomusa anaerophila]|uniref:Flagellar hook-associated protein 3 n=1 Tax=Methylomusa anaerophila TaxID=1930071 RepID=A0A348AKU4_9FIRM|nr:flagellar hook-associated protein FlgL [Methylomusa anaerophila]BBB91692.1 flagellar hook-associated protein 3 [Methylomusa anaerophila]HML88574.1 flagellar hook-associated protein FlgL [Methylomusa anaerophila]